MVGHCHRRAGEVRRQGIGSALVDSGFDKTRIVLQQWNQQFSPVHMRIDSRIPDLFLVSSMHLHSAECDRLVREANRMEPARRPLIIVGGDDKTFARTRAAYEAAGATQQFGFEP